MSAEFKLSSRPSSPILTIEGLSKRFDGSIALRAASLAIGQGERHALVGENGAGKSTLIKIVSGNLTADAGSMQFDGASYRPANPAAARRAGISVVHQELSVIGELTVAENVLLGDMPTGRLGRVDWRELRRRAKEALDRLGLAIDLDAPAGVLSIARQQMVEIARAIAAQARLLIMDEPTSSLGPREAEQLWAVTRDLQRQGIAILFVSHKLDEVLANSERVTVLRDGATVASQAASETDAARLVTQMVGRELGGGRVREVRQAGEVALKVAGLTRRGAFQDVSFVARAGEIVGFAGLIGAGRTEVMRAILGADAVDRGEVELAGRRLAPGRPREAIAAGLGFVPENRKEEGLFLNMSVAENIAIPGRRPHALSLLRIGEERSAAGRDVERLGIVTASLDQSIATLSGGNQQKAILARWLALDPRVLIVDEPTRGIDVGAKQDIYALIRAHADKGRAVVMVSSEIPELLAVADRILVMRAGRIVGELGRATASEAAIGALALGIGDGMAA